MKHFYIAMLFTSSALTGCSSLANLHNADKAESTPTLMIQYGCPTYHVIPGVPGAVGKVGPSLRDLSQRSYLAGTLENSPENLVRWIQHTQRIHPGTAIPEMGVTSSNAKTITAFLLKGR